jgi:hypothetical protein
MDQCGSSTDLIFFAADRSLASKRDRFDSHREITDAPRADLSSDILKCHTDFCHPSPRCKCLFLLVLLALAAVSPPASTALALSNSVNNKGSVALSSRVHLSPVQRHHTRRPDRCSGLQLLLFAPSLNTLRYIYAISSLL